MRSSAFRVGQQVWIRCVRQVKRVLPRTLFARTLLIIITPVLIAQTVATFVFFDRHWHTVTNRLTYALAGDVGMIADIIHAKGLSAEEEKRLVGMAQAKMDLDVAFAPGAPLPSVAQTVINPLQDRLRHALRDKIAFSFTVSMRDAPETVTIRVGLPEGLLTVRSPERRIYTPTTMIFILWMLGSSALLSGIALLFMRNQIRPIRRLALAAEEFGKGRDVPSFKPEGAVEVRQAATALLIMRDRLRRQITQRTAMLSGVSHDLRTPLTRMKLQLALMPESEEIVELRIDIAEMETMVEAYLAFARGEEAEPAILVDLETLLQEVVAAGRKQNPRIMLNPVPPLLLAMRRNAMKRCLANLVTNAARHGKSVQITAGQEGAHIHILIDDDGPGIPLENREDVFRPFVRLDESRNTTAGSVGLGLTIARDIARFHGGDVLLEDSPMGGLRARVRVPV